MCIRDSHQYQKTATQEATTATAAAVESTTATTSTVDRWARLVFLAFSSMTESLLPDTYTPTLPPLGHRAQHHQQVEHLLYSRNKR